MQQSFESLTARYLGQLAASRGTTGRVSAIQTQEDDPMTPNRFATTSPRLFALALAAVLAGLLAPPARLAAQALPAATKALDISVYGGYISSNSDYGPYRNTGEAFGVEITRPIRFPIVPSIEGRFNFTNGPAVRENTYLPGVRGTATYLHVLHPYAAVFFGYGTIDFNFPNHGYQSDDSAIFAAGGGLNVDVSENFGLMADFQYQHWSLGANDSLTPNLFLFGVTYHIPFRPFNRMPGYRHRAF
jgi:hypothetical protein